MAAREGQGDSKKLDGGRGGTKDDDKALLAGFHHTISEQLNARLSESPKFFGLLIIVSTGYGYVLAKPDLDQFLVLVSLLAYGAALWASWYLAALGYAFRFLQNSQHLIERALGWSPHYVPGAEDGRMTGQPPPRRKHPGSWFWLLPSIYHPHAAGLATFVILICVAFCWRRWTRWPHVWVTGIVAASVGITFIGLINRYYLERFRSKRKGP